MSARKRILIDPPSEMTVLAARHLDATEGPVQIGSIVDTAARSAITTVLRYIANAHNGPIVEESTATPHTGPGIGEIQVTRQLGRGLIVDKAPARARMTLALLAEHGYGLSMASDNQINIADQVLYEVTGYDAGSASLLLELVEDWRKPSVFTFDRKLTEAEVKDIKARWREAHGTPGTAHVVTEIHADDRQPLPGFRPFTPAHIPKTGNPADALVVEPYRADDGSRKWVFRCWGTGTCDGWLSLDHTSQQWAEQARDRHVAEEHAQEQPMPDPDDPPVQCWHTEPDTPCDWDVCRQPERLAAGDRGTDPARKERP